MSLLDQAKKEAKRLFNLAKANQEKNQSQEIQLKIPQLNAAKEILATINGYKNWHEYEEVLKNKDIIFNKVDKNTENKEIKSIIKNKEYFIQNIKFNHIEHAYPLKKQVIVKQNHKPVILGHKKKSIFENKQKFWLLNQYPVFVSGAAGSGRKENLLSLSYSYIKNQEGLIYIEGDGLSVVYEKIFSFAKDANRINDLYCLNFMLNDKYVLEHSPEKTHSIDPINPMLGNNEYFLNFFGKELGSLIHAMLKVIHKKDQIMDTQSLESILMLNNLLQWYKEGQFKDLPELSQYLVSIGLSPEENDQDTLDDALRKHAVKCMQAYEMVHIFKTYAELFKFDCTINMEEIFLQRKILVVLLPTLEKLPDSISLLGELIVSQIAYAESKTNSNTHLQNIILDQFIYYCKNIKGINLSDTKNNYIFSNQDYYCYKDKELFNTILNNIKTYIVMQFSGGDLPVKFKLDIFDNLVDIPKEVFGGRGKFINNLTFNLKNQEAGEAIVFSLNKEINIDPLLLNSEIRYYAQKIKCVHVSVKRVKDFNLFNHNKPSIYIKK